MSVYTWSNTHCDFMTEGGGPASENKAGIYSRLHSKQGEAQWTQAPDRHRHPAPHHWAQPSNSLRPKPLLFQECWLVLGCHHHPCALSAAVLRQGATASEHCRCKVHQIPGTKHKHAAANGSRSVSLRCSSQNSQFSFCFFRRYSWLSGLQFFLSLLS